MDKIDKEQIERLKLDKKYEEIFIQYGKDAYKKYVPKEYRKKDLKKLKKEGKYEDIYSKYGENEYNKLLTKAMYKEIKENRGISNAILWRFKQKAIDVAKYFGIMSTVLFLGGSLWGAEVTKNKIEENAIKYEKEIKEYNKNISNYAQEIKSMNLNYTQLFMKVMDDMWGSIKGYGEPKRHIEGFQELELATEEGYGVCRNMASDIAKKLNCIDSKYNARVMPVYMGEDGEYKVSNIDRTFLEENETIRDNDEDIKKESEEKVEDIDEEYSANHEVVIVDLPEYNLTVVLDPTNPGIGVYLYGKIIMLNSSKENRLDFVAMEFQKAIVREGGLKGIKDTIRDYINSYRIPKLKFNEIEEIFGLQAQNEALEQVKNMKDSKGNTFKNSIKVDLSKQTIAQTEKNSRELNIDNEIER